MKLFEVISNMPDGKVIINYANGFSFEGFVDTEFNPTSGILTTPERVKYNIPEFKEDVFSVLNLIESSQLEKYRI